jgi:hypothetical protein
MKRYFFTSILILIIFSFVFAAESIVDSYDEGHWPGYGSETVNGAWHTFYGQSFTGNGSNITKAIFYLKKAGVPGGNAYAKLYAHSGTYGTSSVATGSALATSEAFDVSTLSGSVYQLKTFTFSSTYLLENGTHYVIGLEYTGGDGANQPSIAVDKTTKAHSGNPCYYYGGSFTAKTDGDMIFYVYGEPAVAGGAGQVIIIGD